MSLSILFLGEGVAESVLTIAATAWTSVRDTRMLVAPVPWVWAQGACHAD
jgi:hypothetical protein